MHKRIISIILVISISIYAAAEAKASTISEIQSQQRETQRQLEAVEGTISGLEEEQGTVEEEIAGLDESLVEILASIDMLKEEIETKKEELIQAEAELVQAKEVEAAQNEAMKKRIQFMYEKGDRSYIQIFFEAKSMTDFLNKADYIEKLYEYDRRKLLEYQEIKAEVEELTEQLEIEKSELEAEEGELEEEQAGLKEMLAIKQAEAENYEVEIAKARQEAAAYKTKIKQQTAQIKKLEEEQRKAQEAAAKKQTSSSAASVGGKYSVAAFDMSVINKSAGSELGKKIATFGCQYIGYPYVAGGTSLTNGADCSGFTQAVYHNFGYSLPRTSSEQRSYGREVAYSEAQPGDIVCYAGHVGIYIGGGMIVHASTAKTGIKVSYATYRPILSVRRVI